jgi:hypothetical protein
MQSKKLIRLFSIFMGGSIWAIIALGLLAVRFDDIKAPFVGVDAYRATTGTIISSKIVFVGSIRGGWQYEIFYKYMIGNRVYISNKISFLNRGNDADDEYASEYVKKYPVGKNILVYYEKSSPEKSVLEPENYSNSSLYLVIVLLAIAVFHFWFVLRYYFRMKSGRTQSTEGI